MDNEQGVLNCLDEIENELNVLRQNADFKSVVSKHFLSAGVSDEDVSTLLHYSAANGLLNLCLLLVELTDNVETRDSMGWTPLMHSVRRGHLKVSQCLIERGGNIQSVNYHGADIMSLAIASGNLNLVKFLSDKIKSTYCTNLLGFMTYVATACTYGYTDIVRFFLKIHPHEIDCAVEKSEMTPLMLAAAGGHTSTVKLLLMYGADPTLKNSLGQTAQDISQSVKDEKTLSVLDVQTKTPTFLNDVQFLFPPLKSPKLLDSPAADRRKSLRKTAANNSTAYYNSQCLTCIIKNDLENIHPLTPNTYISRGKKKRLASPDRVKDSIELQSAAKSSSGRVKKRSRSLDCILREHSGNNLSDKLVKTILQENGLSEIWTLFESQDITLRTFLTINEEDLEEIGVSDATVRTILLEIIDHYKKLFPF